MVRVASAKGAHSIRALLYGYARALSMRLCRLLLTISTKKGIRLLDPPCRDPSGNRPLEETIPRASLGLVFYIHLLAAGVFFDDSSF